MSTPQPCTVGVPTPGFLNGLVALKPLDVGTQRPERRGKPIEFSFDWMHEQLLALALGFHRGVNPSQINLRTG